MTKKEDGMKKKNRNRNRKNTKKNLEGGSGREYDWDKQTEIAKELRIGIERDKEAEETYVKEGRNCRRRETRRK
jgi:hypothetical protein